MAIDLFVACDRISAHHARSSRASLDNRHLCWQLLGGKCSSILYSLQRKVRPKGTTVATKLRYPVTFWRSRSETNFFSAVLCVIDCPLSSFLAGSRMTIWLVSNSTPAKLATIPSSFFDSFILRPTW